MPGAAVSPVGAQHAPAADDLLDRGAAHTADPENCGFAADEVDDGRLHADAARSAVEHDPHVGAEIGTHVRGGGRAHTPEPVGRRRRHSAAERREQLERDRMVGHPQAHRVAPARHLGRHSFGIAAHDDRQRSRPEGGRELPRRLGHVTRELVELRGAGQVHDHRMVGGPALHLVEPAHGIGARGVGTEPVDRLGRECHELAGAQGVDGACDVGHQ